MLIIFLECEKVRFRDNQLYPPESPIQKRDMGRRYAIDLYPFISMTFVYICNLTCEILEPEHFLTILLFFKSFSELCFSILDLLHGDMGKLSKYSLKSYNCIAREMYSSYYFFSLLIPIKTSLRQP